MAVDVKPRKAFEALGGEHGLPILQFLRGREWTLASQVAEALGIHTTTASRHLALFYEAGIVERKPYPAKRPTVAYRLPSPVLRIELDLAPQSDPADGLEAGRAFVEALRKSAAKIGGAHLETELLSSLFGGPDWREALRVRLEGATDARAFLDALVQDTHRRCAERFGTVAGARLVGLALREAREGRRDLFPEGFD